MEYVQWGEKEIHLVSKEEPAWLNQQFRVCHREFKRWEKEQIEKKKEEGSSSGRGGRGQDRGRMETGGTNGSAQHQGAKPVPTNQRTGSSGGRTATDRTIEDTGKRAPRLKGGRLKAKGSKGRR